MRDDQYFTRLAESTAPHVRAVIGEITSKGGSLSQKEAREAVRASGEPCEEHPEQILLMMVMQRHFILREDGRIGL